MITSIFILVIMYIIIKHYDLKISINKKIIIFLFTLSIPLIYLQTLILTNSLYEVNASSGLQGENLNLEIKDGYVGEKLENEYVIYQQDGDIHIPIDNLMVNQNSQNYSFEELTIIYNIEILFKDSVKEWLCKDFLMYKPILNANKELGIEENKEKIYNLYLKDDLKIKGEQ